MRADAIKPGMTLELKRDNPYGYQGDQLYVLVTEIVDRSNYRVPWIYSPAGAFRPSDFKREVVARTRVD